MLVSFELLFTFHMVLFYFKRYFIIYLSSFIKSFIRSLCQLINRGSILCIRQRVLCYFERNTFECGDLLWLFDYWENVYLFDLLSSYQILYHIDLWRASLFESCDSFNTSDCFINRGTYWFIIQTRTSLNIVVRGSYRATISSIYFFYIC